MALKNLVLAAICSIPMMLTGCDTNDGPAEKAGEKVDNAVDNAGNKLEEAGDTLKEKMDQ